MGYKKIYRVDHRRIGDLQIRTDDPHPSVASIIKRSPNVKQLTPEWHALRRKILTCSRFGAVNGTNPYCTSAKMYRRMIYEEPEFAGNAATRWGQKYEPVAIRMYETELATRVLDFDVGVIIDKEHEWLGGSPDGIVRDNPVVIEVKCPSRRVITDHSIPPYYYDQVQGLLRVLDLPRCHFIEFIPSTDRTEGTFAVKEYARDDAYWGKMFKKLRAFWTKVETHYKKHGMGVGDPMLKVKKDNGDIPFETAHGRRKFREGRLKVMHGRTQTTSSLLERPDDELERCEKILLPSSCWNHST